VFAPTGVTGLSLPERCLCLTFDDGPGEPREGGSGPRTRELADFLTARGIPGAFFMVGKHVRRLPGLPAALTAGGHLSANHTFHHVDLLSLMEQGGDVAAEVRRAHALVTASAPTGHTLFRPPYGSWTAALADRLNADVVTAAAHLGPVLWDVDACDWAAWRDRRSAKSCADDYLRAIEVVGRGIVLMHDSTADSDDLRARNRTFDMVRLLVPELQARGYRFVGLPEVPEIADALSRHATFLLEDTVTHLSVELAADGRAVLRTSDGSCLAPVGGGGGAVKPEARVTSATCVEVLRVDAQRVGFRTRSGHFLGRGRGPAGLEARSTVLGADETFRCRLPEGSPWRRS
jgi:peptidoglycan/xylan/chitin deacetylase (PgdA/CDA1 family)